MHYLSQFPRRHPFNRDVRRCLSSRCFPESVLVVVPCSPLAFFIFTAFRTHGAQKTIYEHAPSLCGPRRSMLPAFILSVFSGGARGVQLPQTIATTPVLVRLWALGRDDLSAGKTCSHVELLSSSAGTRSRSLSVSSSSSQETKSIVARYSTCWTRVFNATFPVSDSSGSRLKDSRQPR
jgi:hypothetical protein